MSDGDTITVLDRAKVQHKIRLNGIDAPEKRQAFGNASKESLSRLAFDRQVEAHCHKKARYGREVCKIMRGATDVNLEQLIKGLPAGSPFLFSDYRVVSSLSGAQSTR